MVRPVKISLETLCSSVSPACDFDLVLDDQGDDRRILQVGAAVRWVPGKRLVAKGFWAQKAVYVKLFFARARAASSWEHEVKSLRLLAEHNIPCPDVLFSGTAMDKHVFILVMTPVEPAVTLGKLWRQCSSRVEKIARLRTMMDLLALHHQCGVSQHDLHWDNFLCRDDILYTLDAGDLTVSGVSLSKSEREGQLSQFCSLLLPQEDVFIDELISYYNRLPLVTVPVSLFCIQRSSEKIRRTKHNKYIRKKIFRRCTEFYCHRSFRQVVLCNRTFFDDVKDFLFQPDRSLCLPDTVMLKEGNSCTVWLVRTATRKYVVKRYNIKNIWHGLKRFARPTNGAHSWRAAHLLQCYGILTPRPVAFVEERVGPCRGRAYFICEYMEGLDFWDFFFDVSRSMAEKEIRANQTKDLFTQLQKTQIRHGDMKGQNLMVTDGGIALLDLDDTRQFTLPSVAAYWHQRDRRRFLRNWQDHPDLVHLFDQFFKE